LLADQDPDPFKSEKSNQGIEFAADHFLMAKIPEESHLASPSQTIHGEAVTPMLGPPSGNKLGMAKNIGRPTGNGGLSASQSQI